MAAFPLLRGALLSSALASALTAQNCTATSTGLVPLSDLGVGTYMGLAGGLYGDGENLPPAAHAAGGQAAALAIEPLDATGSPSADGRIVLISIGMSNTTQEFSTWLQMSNADPNRSGAVTVVDVAQGGQDARRIADPNADYWRVALQRLDNAGVSAQQVQVAWLKQAVARPSEPFPDHAQELQSLEATIVQILKQKFPNIRICYLSSRIYAGYATSSLNPEPFAYEYGSSQQWLIQQQISGDAALNYDASKGPVMAPWLAWGPYLWADGTSARSDDLTWVCSDFATDGTHPSAAGKQKVADLLDQHFTTDPTATPWYLGAGGSDRAAALPYGSADCSGSLGELSVRTNSTPWIGNPNFTQGIANAVADSPAVLFWSRARAALPVDGCTLLVDPVQLWRAESLVTNMSGRAVLNLAIPNDSNLIGLSLFTQWLVLDPLASGLQNLIGGGVLSPGVEMRLGTQ